MISFRSLYGDDTPLQRKRYIHIGEEFTRIFGMPPERFYSAPGRTEICGNHTDHNNGKVLSAAINLDVAAAVARTDDGMITVVSRGFETEYVSLRELFVHPERYGRSSELIRGVAAAFAQNYRVGGFKAYTESNVLKGSGVSSSAAFEVLLGTILSDLYCGGGVSAIDIGKVGQYAENVYFGKPSGLLDQMTASVGGFVTMNFAVPGSPVIESIAYDFEESGYSVCITDTKGDHADLTADYAAIPYEMKSVGSFINGNNAPPELAYTGKNAVASNIKAIRDRCGDRAVLRAFHFFDENERVDRAVAALRSNNFEDFLLVIKQSGDSSYKYLQNIYPPSTPFYQGVALALYIADVVLENGKFGVARVHGGGFAGTIQAFVKNERAASFVAAMDNIFGQNSCQVLRVRPIGGTAVENPEMY
jgi:galactokinase